MRGKANYARWLMGVFFLLVVACTAAAGEIIYVDADAAGEGNGSSWTDAYWCLQDALDAARSGDEIRVANGVYKPGHRQILRSRVGDRTIASGDRTATFQLVNGVSIKGGYAGFEEPDPNARNIDVYETILSGDLAGNDIDVDDPFDLLDDPGRAENSEHVVTSIRGDPDTVLDGFVVTGGNAESIGIAGGGMVILDGSPTILNCIFRRNIARVGGAIYIEPGRSLLGNCKFESNLAEKSGGALYGMDVNLAVSECSFTRNWAGRGGGVFIHGDAVLTGCVFRDNSSQSAGGIYHPGGKLELMDCAFSGNSGGYGGAVNTGGATANNCIFSANWATDGGAIYGSVQSIANCTFTGNTAERGGALGGMQGSTIRNSVFAGNRADVGGAICTSGSGPNLIFCTLSGNSALNGSSIGRSPRFHAPRFLSMTISNCILWNDGDEIGTLLNEFSDISIVYSDVRGGWPGQGNIDVDPHFAESGYWQPDLATADVNDNVWVDGDYHLKSQAGRWDTVSEGWVLDDVTSPCVDAGDPASPIAFEPFPNGGIINIGAYGGTAEASKSPSGLHAKYGVGTEQSGWDFVDETENGAEDIWRILEGQGYPRLWWELTEDGE